MKKLLALALLAIVSWNVAYANDAKTFDVQDLPKTWASGTPITTWQHDDLYVFEFWATWCGPCLQAIPHMEEMWKEVKGKGIHFIGVNVNRESDFNNQKVMEFIAKQPVKPTYAMVHDTNSSLAKRHKINGIPNALIVQNGKIIWRGHPASLTADKLIKMRAKDGEEDCVTCKIAEEKSITPPVVVESKPAPRAHVGVLGVDIPASALPTAKDWAQGTPITSWKAGEIYLLEFWASWCGPCRAAIPHLEDLHEELKDKGVTVIGVNMDRGYDTEKILAFMERQPVVPTYALVYGTESEVARTLKPRAIPYGVLVRDGVVVWAGHPSDLTPEKILMYRNK